MIGGLSELPFELWREIILMSGSPLSLKPLTGVSKAIRTLTLPIVFENLCVSFPRLKGSAPSGQREADISGFFEFWTTLQADEDLRRVVRRVSITVKWVDRHVCEVVFRK